MLKKSTTRSLVYLQTSLSGLGLKSIRFETEIHYIKKGIYLEYQPEMERIKERFVRLAAKGWRNPITDAQSVLQKYDIELPQMTENITVNQFTRQVAQSVAKQQQQQLRDAWNVSMHYARLVTLEGAKIIFPALQDIRMEDWMFSLIHAAEEEQVYGLGANPLNRRRCRYGCNADENAYHTVAACPTAATTACHDEVVHLILRSILKATAAPEEVHAQLKPSKASLVADYMCGARAVKVRAGVKIQTDPQLYHNRPDIFVYMDHPKKV